MNKVYLTKGTGAAFILLRLGVSFSFLKMKSLLIKVLIIYFCFKSFSYLPSRCLTLKALCRLRSHGIKNNSLDGKRHRGARKTEKRGFQKSGLEGSVKNRETVITSLQLAFRRRDRNFMPFTIH